MATHEELVAYIQNRLDNGVSREVLENALKTAGWIEEDIKNAFASLGQGVPTPAYKTSRYGVPGYEGILSWRVAILVVVIPILGIFYFLYLIVIAYQKKRPALFWEGLKQVIISVLVCAIAFGGLCFGVYFILENSNMF